MELSETDTNWLKVNYPEIQVFIVDGTTHLAGFLDFDMLYDPNSGKFALNPEHQTEDKFHISDRYQIEIVMREGKNSILPEIREIGGRFEALAKQLAVPVLDLHAYPNGTLCLCARQAEQTYFPDNFDLKIYIQQLAIPFFYSHTFFERYKYRPWGEHAHGGLGTLEYYSDQKQFGNEALVTKTLLALSEDSNLHWPIYYKYLRRYDIPAHLPCVCGSNKRIGKCHPAALVNLKKLKNDLRGLGISLSQD